MIISFLPIIEMLCFIGQTDLAKENDAQFGITQGIITTKVPKKEREKGEKMARKERE